MKHFLAGGIVAAVLIGSVVVAFLLGAPNRPADPEVARVMGLRQSCYADALNRGGTSYNVRNYYRGLNRIDARACPASFQAAFNDYRRAWQKYLAAKQSDVGELLVAGGLAFVPGAQHLALHVAGKGLADARRAKDAPKDTDAAWQALREAARRCGVAVESGDDF